MWQTSNFYQRADSASRLSMRAYSQQTNTDRYAAVQRTICKAMNQQRRIKVQSNQKPAQPGNRNAQLWSATCNDISMRVCDSKQCVRRTVHAQSAIQRRSISANIGYKSRAQIHISTIVLVRQKCEPGTDCTINHFRSSNSFSWGLRYSAVQLLTFSAASTGSGPNPGCQRVCLIFRS